MGRFVFCRFVWVDGRRRVVFLVESVRGLVVRYFVDVFFLFLMFFRLIIYLGNLGFFICGFGKGFI